MIDEITGRFADMLLTLALEAVVRVGVTRGWRWGRGKYRSRLER